MPRLEAWKMPGLSDGYSQNKKDSKKSETF